MWPANRTLPRPDVDKGCARKTLLMKRASISGEIDTCVPDKALKVINFYGKPLLKVSKKNDKIYWKITQKMHSTKNYQMFFRELKITRSF